MSDTEATLYPRKQLAATMIDHMFPIRHALAVKVTLPIDMTRKEATRLGDWAYAMAVENE